ncbi:MAG: 1-acyl-sn-glycerol-3-phosphate acyltransferase [Syntrophaceae bacterium]|nr:1-acyl-sn-glycerol-3-phosphate acyltransferase [Syntrophaceae bacterium]
MGNDDMRSVKLLTFIAFTLVAVFILFVLAVILFPWIRKLGPGLLQLYSRISLSILRVRVDAADPIPVGVAKDKGIILIANHVSVLDIFLMSALYRTLFLSKEEVAHYPVIGIAARLIGIYFLKRESPFDRHRVIRKIASQSNGRIITIFPQGTTSALENLLPFKRGIFKTVELNHGTILLPAAIRYREDPAIAWRRDQILIDNLKAVCAQKRIHVKVSIAEPMSISDYTDKTIDDVCCVAQERVFSRLKSDY